MSTFEDRQNAFETKYAHDAEMKFKAEARRNKKVAAWAAELLGKDAGEYTVELIKADMEEAGADDVVRKLVADLGAKADEATIREKIAEFDIEAKEELMSEE